MSKEKSKTLRQLLLHTLETRAESFVKKEGEPESGDEFSDVSRRTYFKLFLFFSSDS